MRDDVYFSFTLALATITDKLAQAQLAPKYPSAVLPGALSVLDCRLQPYTLVLIHLLGPSSPPFHSGRRDPT
jgi:hypothetical protein